MTEHYILQGDALSLLKTAPSNSVQCCVTSPPYWGLRDYGCEGQIGLEATPEEYVANLVAVFREGRRVLRPDGVLWLNLGDSYAGSRAGEQGAGGQMADRSVAAARCRVRAETRVAPTLKPKNLVGIPWRVAFALQADGWYLRSDVIWHKPNPMPESVTDRPTRSHEYLFLLTKSARYFYDSEAVKEPAVSKHPSGNGFNRPEQISRNGRGRKEQWEPTLLRNARSVWTINTKPFKDAHFAVFPPELARRCVLAGSRPGDTVLDPFGGAGTVEVVCREESRSSILLELNPEYIEIARRRVLTPR